MEKTLATLAEIDKHYRNSEFNPQPGQKFYLEVVVADPDEAKILIGWLYNTRTGTELMGVELKSIHFGDVFTKEDIVKSLRALKEKLGFVDQIIL